MNKQTQSPVAALPVVTSEVGPVLVMDWGMTDEERAAEAESEAAEERAFAEYRKTGVIPLWYKGVVESR